MKILPRTWTADGPPLGHVTGPGPGPPEDGEASWLVATYDWATGTTSGGWTYENSLTGLAAPWPIYELHDMTVVMPVARGPADRSWHTEVLITRENTDE